MRKRKNEIQDIQKIKEIFSRNTVCRVGFSKDYIPYIVPLNYGYDDSSDFGTVYVHTGYDGQKIDFLKSNDNVCVEIDEKIEPIIGNDACNYSMKYISAIGIGKASILESDDEKKLGLNIIMRQLTGKHDWNYREMPFKRVCIMKIKLTEIFGRKSGYEDI